MFQIGDRVKTPTQRGVGVIVRHHEALPGWVVRFGNEKFPLTYFDELLEYA